MRLVAIAVLCVGVAWSDSARANSSFQSHTICTFALPGAQIGYGTGLVVGGDFNADGLDDFAILDPLGNRVRAYLQLGTSWEERITQLSGTALPVAFDCADLNADGLLDLAIACRHPGVIKILEGDGMGQFGQVFSLAVDSPAGVRAGLLNDDDEVDLAVVDDLQSTILIARRHPNGTYTLADGVIIEIDDTLETVTVGDLDGDGRDDLVVPCPLQDAVALVTNQGAGNFSVEIQPVGNSPLAACLLQANDDPALEVVVTNRESANVTVLQSGAAISFSSGLTPWGVTASDLNGDGLDDVAVARAQHGGVDLLHRDPAGGFQWTETFALPGSARSIQAVGRKPGQLPGLVVFSVHPGTETGSVVYLENLAPAAVPVLRGDVNGSGTIDIADLVELVSVVTASVPALCSDACDVNDDGWVNIVDLIGVARMLTTSAHWLPFNCAIDDSPDALSCDSSACP